MATSPRAWCGTIAASLALMSVGVALRAGPGVRRVPWSQRSYRIPRRPLHLHRQAERRQADQAAGGRAWLRRPLGLRRRHRGSSTTTATRLYLMDSRRQAPAAADARRVPRSPTTRRSLRTASRSRTSADYGIWVMNADGSGGHTITPQRRFRPCGPRPGMVARRPAHRLHVAAAGVGDERRRLEPGEPHSARC